MSQSQFSTANRSIIISTSKSTTFVTEGHEAIETQLNVPLPQHIGEVIRVACGKADTDHLPFTAFPSRFSSLLFAPGPVIESDFRCVRCWRKFLLVFWPRISGLFCVIFCAFAFFTGGRRQKDRKAFPGFQSATNLLETLELIVTQRRAIRPAASTGLTAGMSNCYQAHFLEELRSSLNGFCCETRFLSKLPVACPSGSEAKMTRLVVYEIGDGQSDGAIGRREKQASPYGVLPPETCCPSLLRVGWCPGKCRGETLGGRTVRKLFRQLLAGQALPADARFVGAFFGVAQEPQMVYRAQVSFLTGLVTKQCSGAIEPRAGALTIRLLLMSGPAADATSWPSWP
jgi:hypothetical protein